MKTIRQQCLDALQEQYNYKGGLTEQTEWSDIDPDSLDIICSVMELEKITGAEVPDEDVRKSLHRNKTVGSFITWIISYGGKE